MRSEPSTGAGDPAGPGSIWRTVTKGLPTALTLLAATLALAGVVVAGSGAVAADGTAELDEDVVTASEGGTAEIAVESEGVESFEVAIGDEDEGGYELRATVTPDGDGVTALTYDPSEAGGGGDPLTADGDAEVAIDDETALDGDLAPRPYDVSVFADGGDEPTAAGALVVESGEPSGADGGDAAAAVTPDDAADVDADLLVEPRETTVSVPVDLDDGATVDVRFRSTDDASTSFIQNREATVADGAATATVDASSAADGDRATLTVSGNEALDEPVTREVLVVDDADAAANAGDSGAEVPGFGPVAGALALLGAALVARRGT